MVREGRAKATIYNQARQWRRFAEWCDDRGALALPATPEVVVAFLGQLAADDYAVSTIRCYTAAIGAFHRDLDLPNPCARNLVKDALLDVAEAKRGAQIWKVAPLTGDVFDAIRPRWKGSPRGLETCAMVGLMRDAIARRSEAARVRWRDLARNGDGSGSLRIWGAEDGRYGGDTAYLGRQTMEDLEAIRQPDRDRDNRIFGIGEWSINRRIKGAFAKAGFDAGYTSDSCHIGMMVDLASAGIGIWLPKTGGRYMPGSPDRYAAVRDYYAIKEGT